MNYILTIGLEIHLKVKSEAKLFCRCKNEQNFDILIPNTNVCPVCTGQPGSLPSINQEVVQKAIVLGKALNCNINLFSKFDRKSYFYPDLPLGYQITQYYKPINVDGRMSFFVDENYSDDRVVGIHAIQIESDTGKMIHSFGQAFLDFNRAGTPLLEIITNPDFNNAEEVSEFLKEFQRIVKYNNISDADMEKGQMRVDVNISIRKNKGDDLGVRIEMKNISSFGMIRRAIEHEFNRQIDFLNNGSVLKKETRSRDDSKGESYCMRSKEDSLDYRYFPEPDIPTLCLDKNDIDGFDISTIDIPYNIIKKFKNNYGFNKEYINSIINDKNVLEYFLYCVNYLSKKFDEISVAKDVAKRISGPVLAYINQYYVNINDLKFDKIQFIEFISYSLEKKFINNQLKVIIDEMLNLGTNIDLIVSSKGFQNEDIDVGLLQDDINKLINSHNDIVKQYLSGKETVIGFFVGQIMKSSAGKYNPTLVKDVLIKTFQNIKNNDSK